jgi:hypothetical protein
MGLAGLLHKNPVFVRKSYDRCCAYGRYERDEVQFNITATCAKNLAYYLKYYF